MVNCKYKSTAFILPYLNNLRKVSFIVNISYLCSKQTHHAQTKISTPIDRGGLRVHQDAASTSGRQDILQHPPSGSRGNQ